MPALASISSALARRIDVVVPWSAAVVLTLVLLQLSFLRWTALLRNYDLAYFRQVEWLILEGESPFVSLRGLHLLADHLSLLLFPIAWASWLIPGDSGLLVIQAAALGLGIVPLWRIARGPGRLGVSGAAVVTALYALFPAVHNLALSGFHPEVVAVPAILFAVLFALEQRWVPYSVAVAIVLLAKEDLALVVIGLGVMALLRKDTRAGLITIATGIAWFGLAVGVIMPAFNDGSLSQAERYAQYGDSTGEVVGFLITHPWTAIADLTTAQNLELLVALLLPVAFVPLLAWRVLLAAVPFQIALLLTNQEPAHTIDFHYTVAAGSIVLAATAFGLSRLTGARPSRPMALILVLVAAGSFTQWANDAPSQNPLAWNDPDPLDGIRAEALALVPEGVPLTVTTELAEVMSQRRSVYNFPQPFDFWEEPGGTGTTQGAREDEIEWAVIDTNATWVWPTSRETWIERWLPGLGFEPVFDESGVFVFAR